MGPTVCGERTTTGIFFVASKVVDVGPGAGPRLGSGSFSQAVNGKYTTGEGVVASQDIVVVS